MLGFNQTLQKQLVCVLLGISGLALSTSFSQAAGIYVTTSASAGSNRDPVNHPPVYNNISENTPSALTPLTGASRVDASAAGGSGSGQANAAASIGHLAVSAAAHASATAVYTDILGNLNSSGVDASTGSAEGVASWNDFITVTGSNYTGGGYLLATLNITGTNSATGTGYANINGVVSLFTDSNSFSKVSLTGTGLISSGYDSACASVGLTGSIACAQHQGQNPNSPYSYSLGNIEPLTVKIQLSSLGTSSLGYTLDVVTSASVALSYFNVSTTAGADGAGDLGHTLLWGGVNGLYNSAGVQITNFSIASDSGFNYLNAATDTTPVPIPASGLLLLSGLSALGVMSKKQLRSPPLIRV